VSLRRSRFLKDFHHGLEGGGGRASCPAGGWLVMSHLGASTHRPNPRLFKVYIFRQLLSTFSLKDSISRIHYVFESEKPKLLDIFTTKKLFIDY